MEQTAIKCEKELESAKIDEADVVSVSKSDIDAQTKHDLSECILETEITVVLNKNDENEKSNDQCYGTDDKTKNDSNADVSSNNNKSNGGDDHCNDETHNDNINEAELTINMNAKEDTTEQNADENSLTSEKAAHDFENSATVTKTKDSLNMEDGRKY